jgi:hypothetical protein
MDWLIVEIIVRMVVKEVEMSWTVVSTDYTARLTWVATAVGEVRMCCTRRDESPSPIVVVAAVSGWSVGSPSIKAFSTSKRASASKSSTALTAAIDRGVVDKDSPGPIAGAAAAAYVNGDMGSNGRAGCLRSSGGGVAGLPSQNTRRQSFILFLLPPKSRRKCAHNCFNCGFRSEERSASVTAAMESVSMSLERRAFSWVRRTSLSLGMLSKIESDRGRWGYIPVVVGERKEINYRI